MFTLLTALALGAGPAPALHHQAADKKKDPIVCQSPTEHIVGTRIKRSRVCKPKSEWDLEEKTTQRQLQKYKDFQTDPGPASGR